MRQWGTDFLKWLLKKKKRVRTEAAVFMPGLMWRCMDNPCNWRLTWSLHVKGDKICHHRLDDVAVSNVPTFGENVQFVDDKLIKAGRISASTLELKTIIQMITVTEFDSTDRTLI